MVHDPSYTAAKKLNKAQLNKQLNDQEVSFEENVERIRN